MNIAFTKHLNFLIFKHYIKFIMYLYIEITEYTLKVQIKLVKIKLIIFGAF